MLSSVATPDNLTTEEVEATVEFDGNVEMAGELTIARLLETVPGVKRPQAEEPQECRVSGDEPKKPLLQEQVPAADAFYGLCQNHGFDNRYESVHKTERDLHSRGRIVKNR